MSEVTMKTLRLFALAGFFLCQPVLAGPLLRCEVTYADATQVIEAKPVADPYPVPSVEIGGRFYFKAVLVGSSGQAERILLYTYFNVEGRPVLIQQAKYLPPFPASPKPVPLTGEQRLYAGPAERELIYRCTLEGVAGVAGVAGVTP
jgi:hypothetical protein